MKKELQVRKRGFRGCKIWWAKANDEHQQNVQVQTNDQDAKQQNKNCKFGWNGDVRFVATAANAKLNEVSVKSNEMNWLIKLIFNKHVNEQEVESSRKREKQK